MDVLRQASVVLMDRIGRHARRLTAEAVTAYIMEEKEQEIAARLMFSEFEFDDEEEAGRILQWF